MIEIVFMIIFFIFLGAVAYKMNQLSSEKKAKSD